MKTKTKSVPKRPEPVRTLPVPPRGGDTTSDQADGATGESTPKTEPADGHLGATED
jgi:hypothetical protein